MVVDPEYNAYLGYEDTSDFLFGLAYELRHAKQGDREFEMVDNGSDSWNKDWENNRKLHRGVPKKNLYYVSKIPTIPVMFDLFLLRDLLDIRRKFLRKSRLGI